MQALSTGKAGLVSMRVLSLFSGIGGLDLGLERAGMTVVAQSEIDPYACRVLRKHWPSVPNLGDITKITEAEIERIGPIDLVCGGFPCTDLSVAGKQAGIHAAKSGLFFDLMRVVRMVRPRRPVVVLENVSALLSRSDWMGAVLGELAESGFDAQWDCIPAQAVGAPHRRDRVFVVGHADIEPVVGGVDGDGPAGGEAPRTWEVHAGDPGGREDVPHAAGEQGRRIQQRGLPAEPPVERSREDVAGDRSPEPGMGRGPHGLSPWVHPTRRLDAWGPGWEAGIPRVAEGVKDRVGRLRALGNSVVPQVAEHVGRLIMDAGYS